MVRWIVGTSLRFRLLVLALAVAVMLVGVAQLRKAPVDVLPEFTPPYVEVQTEALGLSAEEVEQLVTVPLEADLLNGTKGVTVLRSESVPGESSIVLLFEPGTSTFDARQLVQEQLTQAHANPNVSQPPQMLQPLSSESRVMIIGISPSKLSDIEASVLARWTIRPRLLGIDGVANVAIFGLRDRQLQVLVDPERLSDKHVTLKQVISTAGNAQLVSPLSFLEASTPGTGGFIDTPNQRLQVRHILPIVTPQELARVPVDGTGEGGRRPLELGDVTRVVDGHQPLIGDAVVNGGTGLLLVVEKFPGADTPAVTRHVEQALDELRPGLAGMKIDASVFRPADFVRQATDNLTLAVVLGCALLAAALLAALHSWRRALVCLAAFAVSLTAAALVLSATESSMNALVFAGLAVAVAVVVDDAVIDVDNVRRRLDAGGHDPSPSAVVLEAAAELRSSMGYATAIILLATLPVLFVEGVAGAFFEPVVRAYALAVVASLVVALTLTPALSVIVAGRRRGVGRESVVASWIRPRYTAALARVVGMRRAPVAAAVVVAVAGLALIPALHGPVVPAFEDANLLVHLDGPPGTSAPEMSRIVARASRDLRSIPGVRNVQGHVGRAVTGDQVVDVNASELWVKLRADADHDATSAAVERTVARYAGLAHSVLTYEKQRIRDVGSLDDRQASSGSATSDDLDVLTGTGRRPLVVRVFGEDLDVLRRQGERVKRLLAGVDGVVDTRVERLPQEPTVAIEVSLTKAQRYGVKPGDVRRAATTLLQGIQVGSLFERQKVFDVVVRAVPESRSSLTDVRNLLLDVPHGGHVRLRDIADVRVRPTPQVIQRDASSRRIDVSANVSGRSLTAVQDDVRQRLERMSFPLEYHAEVIDHATGARATVMRFVGVALAAAIGILLLLQAAFGSWRRALVAFLALPLALVGGELAGLAHGAFSLGALLGLLAVFALTARQAVALFRHYRDLEHHDGVAWGPALVVRGSADRLAPVVTSALATAAAMLPFVVLGDRPGYELVRPLAVVVLGGLVSSTLLVLFALPAFYVRLGPGKPPSFDVDTLLVRQWPGFEPDLVRPVGASEAGRTASATRQDEQARPAHVTETWERK